MRVISLYFCSRACAATILQIWKERPYFLSNSVANEQRTKLTAQPENVSLQNILQRHWQAQYCLIFEAVGFVARQTPKEADLKVFAQKLQRYRVRVWHTQYIAVQRSRQGQADR